MMEQFIEVMKQCNNLLKENMKLWEENKSLLMQVNKTSQSKENKSKEKSDTEEKIKEAMG